MSGNAEVNEMTVDQDVTDATSETIQGEYLRIRAIGRCTWEVYNGKNYQEEEGVKKKELSPGEEITIDFKPKSLKRSCVTGIH